MLTNATRTASGWGHRLPNGSVAHFYVDGESLCGLRSGYDGNLLSGGRSGTAPDDACTICTRKLAGETDRFAPVAAIDHVRLADPVETDREPDVVDPPAPSNPGPEVAPPSPVEPEPEEGPDPDVK